MPRRRSIRAILDSLRSSNRLSSAKEAVLLRVTAGHYVHYFAEVGDGEYVRIHDRPLVAGNELVAFGEG
jgi:hypothetical protein